MSRNGVDTRSTSGWGTEGSSQEGRYPSTQPPVQRDPPERSQQREGGVSETPRHQPDIVFVVDSDGKILYANRTPPEGDVVGTMVLDYILPPQRDAVRACLDRVFDAGAIDEVECVGMQPFTEGSRYQCRIAPNTRAANVVSATIIARDVTRWRNTERELRDERDLLTQRLEEQSVALEQLATAAALGDEAEAVLGRFRALLDLAGEAILVADPGTGRLIDVNETACRWLGRPRDTLLTMTIRDIDLGVALTEPSQRVAEHGTETRELVRPVVSRGVLRRRDGSSFPVEVALARRRFAERDFWLVVARDITERPGTEEREREREDSYRPVFELSRDAIYLSNRDGTVADVNDAAIAVFGYSRGEFIGLQASRLYNNPTDIRTFQQAVQDEGAVRDLAVDFRTKSGEPLAGLLTATLRHAVDGSVLGYHCLMRPLARRTQEPTPVPQLPAETEPHGATKVLVVDSEPLVLREAKAVLERAGISAVTAATPAAALAILRSDPTAIGAVLLGLELGELATSDSLRLLGDAAHETPVLLMSREITEVDVADTGDERVVGVVRKPIYPLSLVRRVRDALRQRAGGDA